MNLYKVTFDSSDHPTYVLGNSFAHIEMKVKKELSGQTRIHIRGIVLIQEDIE